MDVLVAGSRWLEARTAFAHGALATLGIPSLLNTSESLLLLWLSGLTAFVGLLWLVHHFFFNLALRRLHVLTPTMKPSALTTVPLVSVIIPARDEERNIGRCLHTLLAQDYPRLEIIVVDDRSRDRTPAIVRDLAARDSRLKLIRNRELPPGWTGKNHAIHLGLRQAAGQYLAFVDADTWYHPRAFSEVVLYALRERADMVSLAGGYHQGSFWERTLQPIIVLFMGFCVRLWKINEPGSSAAFAAGHFIFVKRESYQRFGGHQAVSGCLLEDFAMAGVVKQRGMTLRVAYAPWLMRVRMYRGFRETCRGWMRIFQASMHQSPWRICWGSVEILVCGLVPWAGLAVGLAGFALSPASPGFPALTLASALAVAAQASLLIRAFPFSSTSRWYVLMLLVTILVVLGLWTAAICRLCTRSRIPWRGSLYGARRAPHQRTAREVGMGSDV